MANTDKGPRPWLKGNRSRTGMSKPKGSGTQSLALGKDTVTNFTFRIPTSELKRWHIFCREELGVKTGQMIRNAVRDYIEDTLYGEEK